MTLTIPVLSKVPNLLKELVKVAPNVTFHEVADPERDPYFKKSEILICDFDLLGSYLYDLPNVKWIQGTWAGIDKLTPLVSKPPPYQITRFTGDHFGKIMGEYVVANIVNYERGFFDVKNSQQKSQWNREGKIFDYRVIFDLTVGILGVGNIGNRIGQILHFLGAKVMALGRRPVLPTDDEYSHISKYFTKDTLPQFLKECDYIVNVLPNTTETNNLLDGDVLKHCSDKQSIFINIGRSNILSETSLIRALNNRWLSAVILDVFDVEPLPESSPLWKMDRVFITPHVAGLSRAKDIAEQFSSNFALYKKNLPLSAVVDFTKGY
ncbi:glyoxylate/hydroxypyruvate reductase A HPR2 [Asbolus verrucosus]|uniref:Glyoxylate/hydroxypyruvate reductase A HPR2 n=1 Tax=Asbolus verrucosus TaxID=1661398 RepID=A0A482VT49_ASBVE|nr:glyoxylate/hydroxypyruvate reductase A HPR2 [Asbolus verrucosus]